jgi:hypothetical protein
MSFRVPQGVGEYLFYYANYLTFIIEGKRFVWPDARQPTIFQLFVSIPHKHRNLAARP